MEWQIRATAIPYVRAYGEGVLKFILPAFTGLAEKADEIAEAEYQRLGSQPAPEDYGGDGSELAEAAQDKGQAFYDTMMSLRQGTLNLFAAGLFHVLEQQLADLCRDGAFEVEPPPDTRLALVAAWYARHFALDLTKLSKWPQIEQLRLIANAVKHGEGGAAEKLRQLRPELFTNPLLAEYFPDMTPARIGLRRPLAGEDFYITEVRFSEYSEAANAFLEEIASYFKANSEELYPRG